MSKEENEEKNPFTQYAKENSIGALRNVLVGNSIIRRIAWLVVLLILLAVTGYAVRNNFRKLIHPPTSTTISTFTPETLDFPAVTVCNLNIFSAMKAVELNVGYAISDLRHVFEGNNATCYNLLSTYTGLENTDFRDLIKTSPQDLISNCRFGGEDCNISDFEPTLTHLGVCFTFNSGRSGKTIRKVNNAGVRNGLQLQLKVNQSDYIGTFAGDAGIKIAVHPQSEPPLPDELGIAVPPGNNAFISFRKRKVEDDTRIHCKQEHDIGDWNFQRTNYSYSQAACLTDSFLTRVADNCRCIVTDVYINGPTAGPYSQLDVCNFAKICCNFEQYSTPIKKPCNPACYFDQYPVATASYSLFPANYKEQSDPRLNSNDSASANIFFETMTVETQHTEYSYGFEEFFAEVGGHLALFIGADIICLFEFFFFVYDAIKYCVMCKACRSCGRSPGRVSVATESNDFLLE